MDRRRLRGRLNDLTGSSAEGAVARDLDRRGRQIVARRWRGSAGEIDLIAREGARLVFVEVKSARTHAAALTRVSRRQMLRIMAAAEEFLSTQPGGLGTDIRFDVATVDGSGQVEILENAFAGF